MSDFGKYKGNFRNHTTSLPTYRTLSKWGKWVDRLSDFGIYEGYIRNHSTSLPAYRTLSQVRGGSTSADLAVLRHYAKRMLTPRSLNVKLGPRRNYHEGRAAIRHYANQPARPL